MQKSTIEVSSRPYGRGSSLSALWLLSVELSTKKKWRNFHQQGNCELRSLLALSSLGSHRQRITTCCTWGKTPERVCVVKTGIWCPDRTAIAVEWHRVAQSSAVMCKKKKSQPHHSLTKVPQKMKLWRNPNSSQIAVQCQPAGRDRMGWELLEYFKSTSSESNYSLPKCWNISADAFASA